MTIENSIRLMAGSLVLTSVLLGYFVSEYWLILTAFVGLNLVQSSFTKFCPAEMLLARTLYNKKTGIS